MVNFKNYICLKEKILPFRFGFIKGTKNVAYKYTREMSNALKKQMGAARC